MPENSRIVDSRRGDLAVLAVVAALMGSAWAFDLAVLQTDVLTPFLKQPALSPVYAFWAPSFRLSALVFLLLLVVLVLAAERLSDEMRTSRWRFAVALSLLATALPFALFLVRQTPALLGEQLTTYPGEEVYFDALRIDGLGDFWRSYSERMPSLSLHGKHFPPGHATLIWLVGRFAGPGTLAVAITVLAVFCGGVLCCWRAFEVLAGETAGRQGALLLIACPSALDFACTSMDAVFFGFASLAMWASVAALSAPGRAATGFLAGAALVVATLVSFSALPLGLCVLVYAALRLRSDAGRVLAQLCWMSLGYILPAVLLRAIAGFDLWRCFEVARRLNDQFMTAVIGGAPTDLYGYIAYGNLTAFAIGAGLGLVGAVALGVLRRTGRLEAFSVAALATLSVMVFAALYQLETERIWLFAMPWLAAVAIAPGPFAPATLKRLLLAGGVQALGLEVLLFTLW